MSTNNLLMPSGIDYPNVLAEFRSFNRGDMTEAEFVERIETCAKCHMCRASKCLAGGGCVGRMCRAPGKKCPKGYWLPVDLG